MDNHAARSTELAVLHVATTDLGDGAGVSALRLHQSLRQLGVISRMAVINKHSNLPEVYEIAHPLASSPASRVARLACDGIEVSLNQILPQNSFSAYSRQLLRSPLVNQSSVFNLHALHRRRRHFAADLCLTLSHHGPVVWTLHDMWAFTGHCTFAFGCERWKDACGACPTLDSHVRLLFDSTAMNLRFKRRIYGQSDLVVVCPSRWLADLVRASPLLGSKRVEHIPYGIDTSIFHPSDRVAARTRLSLPHGAHILLCSAFSFSDPRKGLRHVWDALARSTSRGLILLMGEGAPPRGVPPGWTVRRLGFLSQPAAQALAYTAADALVFLEDNDIVSRACELL